MVKVKLMLGYTYRKNSSESGIRRRMKGKTGYIQQQRTSVRIHMQ